MIKLRHYLAFWGSRQTMRFAAVLIHAIYLGFGSFAHSSELDCQLTLTLSTATLPPIINKEGDGYLNKVLDEIGSRTRNSFELVSLPLARGLTQANAGLLDGDLARTSLREDQYPNLLRVPEAIIEGAFAGFYVNPAISVNSIDDWSQYRVGYVRSWAIAESLFSNSSNTTVTSGPTQLMDMLAANRIDIAFLAVVPGRQLAAQRGIQDIQVTEIVVRQDLYMYLHTSQADSLVTISDALKAMKEDGTYGAIMRGRNIENQ